MNRFARTLFAMSLIGSGLVTGCSDDAAQPGTVVDVAVADGNFTLLAAALTRAGLVDDLSGTGPFTVFAPTDAAFAAAGIDLADINSLPVDQLVDILGNHVISGEVPSTAIPARADNLSGLTLLFSTSGGVTVNGVSVTAADVEASNGVIHVVDEVIMPADVVDMAGIAGLTSLAGAVTSAGLVPTLQGAGPFTVFAPTDAAFAALPSVPAGQALVDVLTYHVLAGETLSTQLPVSAHTLSGASASVLGQSVIFAGTKINQANIVSTDIKVTNGVIHVIDGVITPSNVAQLATYAGLTELLGVVGSASAIPQGTALTPTGTLAIGDALASPGVDITVFAPTNAAFQAISSVSSTLSADQLRNVLLYHVIGSPVFSTDLTNGAVPTLLDLLGANPDLTVNTSGPTVAGCGNTSPAAIGPADIVATNGVIHLVDAVLLPIGTGCP